MHVAQAALSTSLLYSVAASHIGPGQGGAGLHALLVHSASILYQTHENTVK